MLVRALYPGSFDPIHNGHIDIALRAAGIFDEVIVGVYDMPKKKLLFDAEERFSQVQQAFPNNEHIRVAKFSGLTVDYAREVGAKVLVRGLRVFSDFELEFHGVSEQAACAGDRNHLDYVGHSTHFDQQQHHS